jgi:methylenetetrahydrofolate--tRNA-(uracil-5-)-methyltransferase
MITDEIVNHPKIDVIRTDVTVIPDGPAILAVGPLMSGEIAKRVMEIVGEDYLSFFDAAAPIVTAESVDMERAYLASRYGAGADYINCPLDRDQYEIFIRELTTAERAPLHEIDARDSWAPLGEPGRAGQGKARFFEGCLPVEVMAERGADTLRFGPMRPVGLPDPATQREPYAVLQLRRDNAEGTLYNMVGFQTNLRWPEQERVFRLIPALDRAEFVRYGVMHRNSFVCAPRVLDYHLRPRRDECVVRPDLFLAGQITGVEGYVESAATGLAAAVHLVFAMRGAELPTWPRETAIGSLLHYLRTAEAGSFQPMNVNLGIFPPMKEEEGLRGRKRPSRPERSQMYAERSREAMESFLASLRGIAGR